MKKIFLTVALGAMLFASCDSNKKSASAESEEDSRTYSALTDSVSVAIGKMNGTQTSYQVGQMAISSPEDAKKFDKDRFLEGLELVAQTDSSDMAFIWGIQEGLSFIAASRQLSDVLGEPLNVDAYLDSYAEYLKKENVEYENLYTYYDEFQALLQKAQAVKSKEAQAEAEKLVERSLNDGYQKTESGLLYKINNPGVGSHPEIEDKVVVQYVGKHVDGTVFDQSPETGATFPLSGVVSGFSEAVMMLGTGGSGTFILPASIAYGESGSGPIAPNETLVFEITLNEIVPAAEGMPE